MSSVWAKTGHLEAGNLYVLFIVYYALSRLWSD
jgi:hypothetical protein